MTAEQLEELLAVYESRAEARADAEFQLKQLGPSLARRVLGAEKLVDAGRVMADALKGHYIVPGSAAAWDAALTAYRESSK